MKNHSQKNVLGNRYYIMTRKAIFHKTIVACLYFKFTLIKCKDELEVQARENYCLM